MDWRELITVDPEICHGHPCFAGTRVMVTVILDNMAAGVANDEILKTYPSLDEAHLRAAIAYAAEIARSRPTNETQQALRALNAQGRIQWSGGKPAGLRGIRPRGGPVSDTVIEDRR